MTVLVIAPLEREFDNLVAGLEQAGLSTRDFSVGRLPAKTTEDGRFVVSQGGLGKVQFALQTQHLIDRIQGVSLVVCAGTSGGLDRRVKPGDVVVGTRTVEHDFKRKFVDPDYPTFDGHADSLNALRKALRESASIPKAGFLVHFAPIASGDEGIADTEQAKRIRDLTSAFAVAWEGAGGAKACAFAGVPFLEVRGISDMADSGAMDAFTQNLPMAMVNVAQVVARLQPLTK